MLWIVQMEGARVPRLLAKQDDPAGDTPREVACGECACHGRRRERARSVVEISRRDGARDDLELAQGGVHDDDDGLRRVRKSGEELPCECSRLAGHATDICGEAQTAFSLCNIDGAVDLVLLPRSEDLTIDHWLRPPQRQARSLTRQAALGWPGHRSRSQRREAADPAVRQIPAAVPATRDRRDSAAPARWTVRRPTAR